jgi:hypothetical protein
MCKDKIPEHGPEIKQNINNKKMCDMFAREEM